MTQILFRSNEINDLTLKGKWRLFADSSAILSSKFPALLVIEILLPPRVSLALRRASLMHLTLIIF